MVVQKKLLTRDEFQQVAELPENAGRRLELIDGEIVEMSPKLNHGLIAALIGGETYLYLKSHPIGSVMVEVDHFVPEDTHNTRRPDVSFLSNDRLQTLNPDANVPLMPDLAVEVKSPSNYYTGQEGLRDKAQYYLAHGARLVWLIYPDSQTIEVFIAGGTVEKLGLNDTLDGGDVLPGFTLAVSQIFAH